MAGDVEPHRDSHRGRARPPRGSGRPAARRSTLPAGVYFAAACVVVLVGVIAAAAALFVSGLGHHRATVPAAPRVPVGGAVPSAYSQAPSTSAFDAIAKRTADAGPLTAAEVFGAKTISDADSKASLRLTTSTVDRRCGAAVWGDGLAQRLQSGGCRQVTRGVYADKHFAAMVTIFDLADVGAADQVVAAADPRSGNGFPLPPPGSVPFGTSFSTARGLAMGHYAVISWVQRADGTGDEKDAALLSLLVTTGRPQAVLLRAARPARRG